MLCFCSTVVTSINKNCHKWRFFAFFKNKSSEAISFYNQLTSLHLRERCASVYFISSMSAAGRPASRRSFSVSTIGGLFWRGPSNLHFLFLACLRGVRVVIPRCWVFGFVKKCCILWDSKMMKWKVVKNPRSSSAE